MLINAVLGDRYGMDALPLRVPEVLRHHPVSRIWFLPTPTFSLEVIVLCDVTIKKLSLKVSKRMRRGDKIKLFTSRKYDVS